MTSLPDLRIGQGFDMHPYSDEPDRQLVLGGVRFPEERGLVGHSDSDVIAHAITDAVLGAAGLGDIGGFFPDTDPELEGADSIELLRAAVAALSEAGWQVMNADCTVVLDSPKIAPARDDMQRRLGEALNAPVLVKGKRTEGIGALGRGEGIACWAVALVTKLGS